MRLLKQRRGYFQWFVVGMVFLKLCLMGIFSSDFQLKLFIPFVDSFISEPTLNPYEVYLANGGDIAFPYPSLMLFIESLALICGDVLGGGQGSGICF